MPQPSRGLPVPKNMNEPKGVATRGEFGNDTDAAPIADQDIREVPRWDPSAEYTSKDARLVPTGLDLTKLVAGQGDCPAPNAPSTLERVGPAGFYDSPTLHATGAELADLVRAHERKP